MLRLVDLCLIRGGAARQRGMLQVLEIKKVALPEPCLALAEG